MMDLLELLVNGKVHEDKPDGKVSKILQWAISTVIEEGEYRAELSLAFRCGNCEILKIYKNSVNVSEKQKIVIFPAFRS